MNKNQPYDSIRIATKQVGTRVISCTHFPICHALDRQYRYGKIIGYSVTTSIVNGICEGSTTLYRTKKQAEAVFAELTS